MINLKNKKVLITGATGGIGKALVSKFSSLDSNILATGTKSEKLDLLKKEFPNINILKFDIKKIEYICNLILFIFPDFAIFPSLSNFFFVQVISLYSIVFSPLSIASKYVKK